MSTIPPVSADCWFITGPTASGKTGVALEVARRLDAEIVSMDSMAVYRRLDIGTAKPTPRERRLVPHHLIDCLEPHQEFSLAGYLHAAHRAVEEIHSRSRQVLFVGGTPLYLKSLLRGIFEGPPADWNFRNALAEEARRQPPGYLHARLATVDAVAASRLHASDARRLIRALEVYEKTGRPISQWQQQFARGRPAEACRVFVVGWPREELYARIDARVDQMFAAGLVEEVAGLLADRVELSRTARQALAYPEVLEHLAGGPALAETIELVKTRTRQFAKRQETWFRSLCECRRIEIQGGNLEKFIKTVGIHAPFSGKITE
jgi:tRNA dimethylallyltransferase